MAVVMYENRDDTPEELRRSEDRLTEPFFRILRNLSPSIWHALFDGIIPFDDATEVSLWPRYNHLDASEQIRRTVPDVEVVCKSAEKIFFIEVKHLSPFAGGCGELAPQLKREWDLGTLVASRNVWQFHLVTLTSVREAAECQVGNILSHVDKRFVHCFYWENLYQTLESLRSKHADNNERRFLQELCQLIRDRRLHVTPPVKERHFSYYISAETFAAFENELNALGGLVSHGNKLRLRLQQRDAQELLRLRNALELLFARCTSRVDRDDCNIQRLLSNFVENEENPELASFYAYLFVRARTSDRLKLYGRGDFSIYGITPQGKISLFTAYHDTAELEFQLHR